jgi:HSP90 family molecular chaperone
VFVRELLSNASDALEKLRYKVSTGELSNAGDMPMEISIETNLENKTLTITDSGIGMTRDELISNLGTIARSGSKQFVEKLKSSGGATSSTDNIIGQFGVGFYSSFMVSDSVTVESKPGTTIQYCSPSLLLSNLSL